MLLFPVRLKASCAAPLVSVMPRLVFAPRVSGLDAGVGALRVRVLAVIVRLPVASWSVSMVGPGREESSVTSAPAWLMTALMPGAEGMPLSQLAELLQRPVPPIQFVVCAPAAAAQTSRHIR